MDLYDLPTPETHEEAVATLLELCRRIKGDRWGTIVMKTCLTQAMNRMSREELCYWIAQLRQHESRGLQAFMILTKPCPGSY